MFVGLYPQPVLDIAEDAAVAVTAAADTSGSVSAPP